MIWSETPPVDFDMEGVGTSSFCWIKPNIWGDDEPIIGELGQHFYAGSNGECGVFINTMNGSIDISTDDVERKYCKVPSPPEGGWSDLPPEYSGWYWVKNGAGEIEIVEVYYALDEETLVYSGIDWPSFRVSPVTDSSLSWVEIPHPESVTGK